MFGNKMFGKLQEAQKKMAEMKTRLDSVYLDGEAAGGKVIATANGNRELKNIVIDEELLKNNDAKSISQFVLTAVNNALEKSQKVNETEMQHAAKDMLPGIPGLF